MKVCTAEESSTLVSQQIECVLSQTFYVANKIEESEMLGFIRNWTQGLWLEPPFFWPLDLQLLDNKQFLHLSLYAYTKQIFLSAMAKTFWSVCCLYIFVLYFSWHTIPRYFCGGTMLYLWMSVRQRLCDILISICIANASALCLWVWRE